MPPPLQRGEGAEGICAQERGRHSQGVFGGAVVQALTTPVDHPGLERSACSFSKFHQSFIKVSQSLTKFHKVSSKFHQSLTKSQRLMKKEKLCCSFFSKLGTLMCGGFFRELAPLEVYVGFNGTRCSVGPGELAMIVYLHISRCTGTT